MKDTKLFYLHFLLADQERRIYAKWCQKRGISYIKMQLLYYISNAENGAKPSELADTMLIPRQTMTGLLDQLEKKKLISRQRYLKDRRKLHIVLEEEGQAMLDTVLSELLKYEMAVMHSIDAEEFRIFNKVFTKLVSELTNQLNNKE